MIGIIRRTFTFFIDGEIFTNLYKSLVRPHLEYGNTVWFPQLKRQSVAIEKVHRRATKLIPALKDLDYKERLRQLKLPTSKYRRYRGDLIQVFKIINEIEDLKFEFFFPTTKPDSTRNSEHKLYVHFLKLKPESLPLAIELHQPGIHFYHVLKKHHLLTSLKVFLTKIQIY